MAAGWSSVDSNCVWAEGRFSRWCRKARRWVWSRSLEEQGIVASAEAVSTRRRLSREKAFSRGGPGGRAMQVV